MYEGRKLQDSPHETNIVKVEKWILNDFLQCLRKKFPKVTLATILEETHGLYGYTEIYSFSVKEHSSALYSFLHNERECTSVNFL